MPPARPLAVAALAAALLTGCAAGTTTTTSELGSGGGGGGSTPGTAAADAATGTTGPSGLGGTASTRRAGSTTSTRGNGTSTSSTRRPSSSTSTTDKTATTLAPPNDEYLTWCTTFKAGIVKMGKASPKTEADMRAFLAEVRALFATLYETAPDAIKADWKILKDAIQDITDITQANKNPEADAASKRITEWTIANCGFDPDKI